MQSLEKARSFIREISFFTAPEFKVSRIGRDSRERKLRRETMSGSSWEWLVQEVKSCRKVEKVAEQWKRWGKEE